MVFLFQKNDHGLAIDLYTCRSTTASPCLVAVAGYRGNRHASQAANDEEKNATWKDIEDAEESFIINYTISYDGKTWHSGYFPWNHGKFICKGEGKWSCPGLRSYRSYGSEVTE